MMRTFVRALARHRRPPRRQRAPDAQKSAARRCRHLPAESQQDLDGLAAASYASSPPGATVGPAHDPSDASREARDAYRQHWEALVHREWEHELSSTNERLTSSTVSQLEKDGLCISGLRGSRRRHRFYGRAVARFALRADAPRHSFQPGDEVVLSRGCPLSEADALRGEIVELGLSHLDVALLGGSGTECATEVPERVEQGLWRLDRLANRTAYERTLAGLRRLTGDRFRGSRALRKMVIEGLGSLCGNADIDTLGPTELNIEGEEPLTTAPGASMSLAMGTSLQAQGIPSVVLSVQHEGRLLGDEAVAPLARLAWGSPGGDGVPVPLGWILHHSPSSKNEWPARERHSATQEAPEVVSTARQALRLAVASLTEIQDAKSTLNSFSASSSHRAFGPGALSSSTRMVASPHPTSDGPLAADAIPASVSTASATSFSSTLSSRPDRDGSAEALATAAGALLGGKADAARLNESQLDAILQALSSDARLTTIQGPPGTGKTATTCALLKLAARGLSGVEVEYDLDGASSVDQEFISSTRDATSSARRELPSQPLLACADSNAAVDQLLEGLLGLGVRAVRVGQPARVSEKLRQATVLAHMESHPQRQVVMTLRERLLALQQAMPALWGQEYAQARRTLAVGWKQMRRWEERMTDDILSSAEVVCSTLTGAGSDQLAGRTFPFVVIDECTQATEPRCATALSLARGRAVLVGDQQQLPPTTLSASAAAAGLNVSLFERAISSGLAPVLLATQYRMHPLLAGFSSAAFYNGVLRNGVRAESRAPPREWPSERPLLYVDFASRDAPAPGGTSRINKAEAHAVVSIIKYLCLGEERVDRSEDDSVGNVSEGNQESRPSIRNQGKDRKTIDGPVPTRPWRDTTVGHPSRTKQYLGREGMLAMGNGGPIGVISPYAGQVALLRRLLEKYIRSGIVEVRTIDGFQGREKEVIILSAVRANERAAVGFLSDHRRDIVGIVFKLRRRCHNKGLNVALTRARRALLVIGDSRTLRADPVWASFLDYAAAAECEGYVDSEGRLQSRRTKKHTM